jgi:hypothetical protein
LKDIPPEILEDKSFKIILVEDYEEVWEAIFSKRRKKLSLSSSRKINKETEKSI